MRIDTAITQWINAVGTRSASTAALSIFFASVLIFLLGAGVLFTVIRQPPLIRARLLVEVILSILLVMGMNAAIGAIAFRPRPFVVPSGITQLIEKSAAAKSFPSDHAGIAFALVVPLVAVVPSMRLRLALLMGAVAVAMGRVLVGVHYVSDVIAGPLIAVTMWLIVHRVALPWFS